MKVENNVFVRVYAELLYALLQEDYYLGGLEEFKITILWWVVVSICHYYIWNLKYLYIKEAFFKENDAYLGPNHWMIWAFTCIKTNAFSFEWGFDLACDTLLAHGY